MRTKENYRGEQFDVTYDKVFRTSEGMGFVLKREEDIEPRMMEVFATDIHIHLANVGCAIFFQNEPRNLNELEYIPFVHTQNIGRAFNLHPYRESGQTHRKTWKRHTRSLLYQICNETSLDLKTVAKVVVSIDIKQHI